MRWHEAPLLPLSAALALGIVAAGWTAAAPGWLLAAGGLLLAVGACAAALGRDSAATAGLLALAVTLGALRGATERLPADHIARAELPPIVKMEGRLAEEPVRWAPDRTRLILDVDGFFDGADRRPASGRLQVTLYGETAAVGEGQRVSAELRLSRPRGFRNPGAFDYRAFLRRDSRGSSSGRRPACRARPTRPSAAPASTTSSPSRASTWRSWRPPSSSYSRLSLSRGARPRWRRAWRW